MQTVIYYLLVTLFLFGTVGFIIGLIKPNRFKSYRGKKATRKSIALTFVIFVILTGTAMGALEPAHLREARLAREATAQQEEQAKKDTEAKRQAEEAEQQRKAEEEQAALDKAAQEADAAKLSEEEAAQKTADDAKRAAEDAARQAHEDWWRRRYYWHQVISVVDGDTVKARVDGKIVSIRVVGINSPEATTRTECFGKEATAKANEFLKGKWIQLEQDPTQANRDKYNRLLRYVWFDNGTDFGRRMIEEGYAHEYTYQIPYQKQAQYKETYKYAQSKDHGLWSPNACNGSTAMPKPKVAPAPKPAPRPTPKPASNCDPNYTPCVPRVSYDLDCDDIGFSVRIIGSDPHGFDGRDNDGHGCESY